MDVSTKTENWKKKGEQRIGLDWMIFEKEETGWEDDDGRRNKFRRRRGG